MKNLFYLLLVLVSCSNQKKSSMKETIQIDISAIPIDKQFTYAVSVGVFTSYELYINDIAAEKDYDPGSQAAIEINPYLLGNGKHKIRLRLLPIQGKDLIDPEGYELSHFKLVKYIKNPSGKGLKYNEEIMKLPLPPMPTPLPYVEMEWEVEIKDLPYKLEGWKNSKVFKKEDSLEIKKQVVAYYEELRGILNDGNTDEWIKRTLTKRKEIGIVEYSSKNYINNTIKKAKEIVKKECHNNMISIEDFDLFYYAGGRILSLERKRTDSFRGIDVNIKGWSVLIYDNGEDIWSLPALIHIPKNDNTFEIIR